MSEEQLDGIIDFSIRILNKNDEILAVPKYRNAVKAPDVQMYLLIDEAGILLPFTDDFDFTTLESAVNDWIARPSLVTRGVAFSAREVIKKLKKLGFQIGRASCRERV